jgi:hypothetical protein
MGTCRLLSVLQLWLVAVSAALAKPNIVMVLVDVSGPRPLIRSFACHCAVRAPQPCSRTEPPASRVVVRRTWATAASRRTTHS